MTLTWQRKHHPDGTATFTAGPYRIERTGTDRQWTCKIFVGGQLKDTLTSFESARQWCLTDAARKG